MTVPTPRLPTSMTEAFRFLARAFTACVLLGTVAAALAQGVRSGDYIVAVVNTELVTAGEVALRMARLREQATRGGPRLPAEAELRKQVLDTLIDERVLTTYARDSGVRIEEPEVDRAVQGAAAQNQLTVAQLRERLKDEGLDLPRFRTNLRDLMMVERVREREVGLRIRVSDEDIDRYLAAQGAASGRQAELNIAQILVTVPEGAAADVVQQRRARAEQALARLRAGENFEAVARELSQDGNREAGGVIGLRPAERLPDAFVAAVQTLKDGEVATSLLRTGAGFHVLKLIERRQADATRITQTRARHLLLRVSPQLSADVAARRLNEYRAQIESKRRSFEELARQHSEDGTAALGGDLGWASPGQYVPEFEEALNRLPTGGLSEPVVSRFGVHLIQVTERRETKLEAKQVREQARSILREQKFEPAYLEWTRELRARAYIELREPPQ